MKAARAASREQSLNLRRGEWRVCEVEHALQEAIGRLKDMVEVEGRSRKVERLAAAEGAPDPDRELGRRGEDGAVHRRALVADDRRRAGELEIERPGHVGWREDRLG